MNTDPIEIKRPTSHIGPDDLERRISTIIEKLKKSFSLDVQWYEPSKAYVFRSTSGFTKDVNGHLQIQYDSIILLVRLPYLLQVQRKSVESQINEALDAALF